MRWPLGQKAMNSKRCPGLSVDRHVLAGALFLQAFAVFMK